MSKFVGYIYKITNILNGKIYFGFASNKQQLYNRKYRHFEAPKSSGQYIDNAIRKYGAHNFKLEVFKDTCNSFKELKEAEIACIELYQTNRRRKYYGIKGHGYNETDGGDGVLGCYPSEETKNKMREAAKGNKNGANNKNRIFSEETKKKISEACKGRIPWNKGLRIHDVTET